MRTCLSITGLIALAAAAAAIAQTRPVGPVTSADAAMRHHLALEYPRPVLRLWAAAPAPCGDAPAAPVESADHRLQQIVGAYTREKLDRGSWFNPWAGPSGPAAAALTAVAPGEGVTSRGDPVVQAAPLAAAGRCRP